MGDNTLKFYSLKEAAEITGFCITHLQRLCKQGKVPHVKRGSRYFFTDEDIEVIMPHSLTRLKDKEEVKEEEDTI